MVLLNCGCDQKREEAPATGAYGALTNEPSKLMAHAQPDPLAGQPWRTGELAVVQTELSPATLYHSTAKTLSFFAHLTETGIGGPTFIAMSTEFGPKIYQREHKIDPALMRESWFVVWFAGATNWTNWDSPWFLTLQHRPAKISFDTNGLHFTFTNEAGYAALMPMYGCYKPAQLATQPLPFYQIKDKKKRVLTWEWYKALPADPLARARYWASALREFPLTCDESFSVDRAHDSVTFRQTFHWLSWEDDWKTKHLKLAPVSPVLALAYREGVPMTFSKNPFDMEIFTSFGPFYGVEGVDSYDVTLPVLRYVNETAGVGTAGWSNAPCFDSWRQAHVQGTWDSARSMLHEKFLANPPPDWAAFAGVNVPPLAQAANALGAARLAYRLGDADTFAAACARFTRAVVQLSAQQRGVNYFRERQPWHSMEPIAASATLASVSRDGWQLASAPSAAPLENVPDLARLWRNAQPAPREATTPSSAAKVERLIPGASPTPFLSDAEAAGPPHGLVYNIETESQPLEAKEAKAASPIWPRLIWSDWKTPTAAPWNFGQVMPSTNAPATIPSLLQNGTTRVNIWR